jgi:hypothetical protein
LLSDRWNIAKVDEDEKEIGAAMEEYQTNNEQLTGL